MLIAYVESIGLDEITWSMKIGATLHIFTAKRRSTSSRGAHRKLIVCRRIVEKRSNPFVPKYKGAE